jgi:hypothetical protein
MEGLLQRARGEYLRSGSSPLVSRRALGEIRPGPIRLSRTESRIRLTALKTAC